ncbi:MAG: hypothetical protein KKG33_06185 [candidate division Zixibacteria bacterium]|nr:hypothetical protein [candidate division Zixibacteria bacterium]MBU1471262.1 hypothetical protein [candidate division Zixibacteria bacterium]MBU2625130.1 hypothetical protein [candidate division Zixibacteria bacterium]
MKITSLWITVFVVVSSLVYAQDTGVIDTCRMSSGVWGLEIPDDSSFSVPIHVWSDDQVIAATICLALNTSGMGWDHALDSLLTVDTFIVDPGFDAGTFIFRRSVIKNEFYVGDPNTDFNFGFNGVYLLFFGGIDQPSLFPAGTPIKVGDLVLKVRHRERIHSRFTIDIDSIFYPPAGWLKFSGTQMSHVPVLVKSEVEVIKCTGFMCMDSDYDCYGDPEFSEGNICETDNCPQVFNPFQEDSDGDGIGDACDFLCGDADASGHIDIDDVVFAISYIFVGGDPPVPIASGDVDCSGEIDIDDVMYLIQYIFTGGNQPCDADNDGTPDC